MYFLCFSMRKSAPLVMFCVSFVRSSDSQNLYLIVIPRRVEKYRDIGSLISCTAADHGDHCLPLTKFLSTSGCLEDPRREDWAGPLNGLRLGKRACFLLNRSGFCSVCGARRSFVVRHNSAGLCLNGMWRA